jgi:hypothetical protein
MRVPDVLMAGTVFVCYRLPSGEFSSPGGTAFLVALQDDHHHQHLYLVTAKHVVEQATRPEQSADGTPQSVLYIRMNGADGRPRYEPVVGEWDRPEDLSI